MPDRNMPSPSDEVITELREREPHLAALAQERAGAARLLIELPNTLTIERVAHDVESHRLWELAGLYFMNSARPYEGLVLFWGLYRQMLSAQQLGVRLHKGMPLVWMSDCYARLGFPVHSKRYLMLTLVEDALREHGHLSTETTGTYFRLAWGRGLAHEEINRYAGEFERLAGEVPDLAGFPEALLQDVDDAWLTEFPSPEEASHYRLTPEYASFLLARLGKGDGKDLERLAAYLLSCMPGCRTKRRQRSASTDYDLVCSMEGFDVDFRSELGRYFVCECKDWSKPADFSTIAKFCRVLDSTKARFGILFSRNGISGARRTVNAEREQLKVFQDRGVVVIAVTEADVRRVVEGINFIGVLREKYEAVRLDLLGATESSN
ncbi:MAG: restriction endonuclease [Vicinamibacterales bacterium]